MELISISEYTNLSSVEKLLELLNSAENAGCKVEGRFSTCLAAPRTKIVSEGDVVQFFEAEVVPTKDCPGLFDTLVVIERMREKRCHDHKRLDCSPCVDKYVRKLYDKHTEGKITLVTACIVPDGRKFKGIEKLHVELLEVSQQELS